MKAFKAKSAPHTAPTANELDSCGTRKTAKGGELTSELHGRLGVMSGVSVARVDEELGFLIDRPTILATKDLEVHQGRVAAQFLATSGGPFGCYPFGMVHAELALGDEQAPQKIPDLFRRCLDFGNRV